MHFNKSVYLSLAAFFLFTAAIADAAPKTYSELIKWQDWTAAAFEQAKRENKMILVNVGMEGCAACYRMDTITYVDPTVVELIEKHFVPIAVDSEARPDIGERYMDWAWPATIFLAPNAEQVLAVRGNRMPRNFVPILNELISKHGAGGLAADTNSPYAAPLKPVTTELTLVRDRVRRQLDRSLNEKLGGWNQAGIGGEQSGSRLRHLSMRAHMYDSAELRALTLKGSEGYLRNIDPVWGGVYSRSFVPGYQSVPAIFAELRAIPEKRISAQANAIIGLATGFALTGDPRYAQGMREMARFMNEWFTAPDGSFYTNQRAQPEDLPDTMTAGRYWSLQSDQARRRYGVPPVDHAIYTDKNGEMIAAYVMAYEAFGEQNYMNTAIRATESLFKQRIHKEGWMIQATDSGYMDDDLRLRPFPTDPTPLLNTQAWFGSALLALHRASGNNRWLEQADRIGKATLQSLYDNEVGGFYATRFNDGADIIAPRKPLEENGTAAGFFYDLWVYTKDPQYADIGERTLRAVAQPELIRHEGKITGELGIALEKVTASYVEFSIVGDEHDPRSQALFQAGLAVYHPRKLMHYERPGRYPARKHPAMYICNPNVCSVPIEDPGLVAEQANLFRPPAT